MPQPVCAIVGVGPGNGAALARKFASEGFGVALLARSDTYIKELGGQIAGCKPYVCDATDEAQMKTTFDRIENDLGLVETLVYNAGAGHFKNIDETTVEMFETDWRVNTLGCLIASQRAIPGMRKLGKGNIVIIGATASWQGNAGFVPFAASKAAQRSLAQSMARHLGPEAIHVSYVIVDGVIDLPRTRRRMPDKPDNFFIDSNHIAEAVWFLTRQQPSAWTFELDLRPYGETW